MVSLLADFPKLSGPYYVGCHDFEWHRGRRRKGDVSSTLFRLYYPAAITTRDKRASWVSNQEYARALCEDVGQLPGMVANWLAWIAQRKQIDAYADAVLLQPSKGSSYPVMIFSHGLGNFGGGNRHLYSSFCCNMASYGIVVAAIEHRDGSGSLAQGHRKGNWIRYDGQPPEVWEYRQNQLRRRLSEVNLCVEAMHRLNEGRIQTDEISKGFCGALDMDSMVMGGHSFGGATAILALNDPQSNYKCGILLDPWAQPLNMLDNACTKIARPVLAILSEQFAFWPDNFDTVQELIQGSPKESVCVSVTGTAHIHQSDVLLILRRLIRFDFRSPFQIDPGLAIDLNTKAAMAFIRRVLCSSNENINDDMEIHAYFQQLSGTHVVIH